VAWLRSGSKSLGPGGFERQVVIKKIQKANADDPEFLGLFLDEARISGLLHHPNVVEVHRFGEHAGTPYLVMEYVEGPSVARVLRGLRATGRRCRGHRRVRRARAVPCADYVHDLRDESGKRARIVHRDVTPSNVLLTRAAASSCSISASPSSPVRVDDPRGDGAWQAAYCARADRGETHRSPRRSLLARYRAARDAVARAPVRQR